MTRVWRWGARRRLLPGLAVVALLAGGCGSVAVPHKDAGTADDAPVSGSDASAGDAPAADAPIDHVTTPPDAAPGSAIWDSPGTLWDQAAWN